MKTSTWRRTTTGLRIARFESKLEYTRTTCQGNVDKATASLAAHKRLTGKYMLDVFGGSGFLTQATNHLGLRGFVLDTNLVSDST